MAAQSGEQTFVGCVASFDSTSGVGFMSCSEAQTKYGRDIALHKNELGNLWMGDTVVFQVGVDASGAPMAKNLRLAGPGGGCAQLQGAPPPPPLPLGVPGGKGAAWCGALGAAPPPPPPSDASIKPMSIGAALDGSSVALGSADGLVGATKGGGEAALQYLLLEQQQEKEMLMQLQMQVTQVVVQSALAKHQAIEQEAAMKQQMEMMQSPDVAQEQQQMMEQQMQFQMQQQMMMAQSFMGPCGMGLGAGTMPTGASPLGTMSTMGTAMPTMVAAAPDFDMEKRYVGVIKSFDTTKGIGFVDCPEIMEKFGCDVFLHASQILNNEDVGDMISFVVQLGRLGQPRAKNIQAIGNVRDPGSGAPSKDQGQVYTGTIKHFNVDKGFGFIACPEIQAQFGCDAYLNKDQFRGFHVGDTVKFTMRLSIKGQPQAKDVEKAEPVVLLPPADLGGTSHGATQTLPMPPGPPGSPSGVGSPLGNGCGLGEGFKTALPPPPPRLGRSAPYAKGGPPPPPPMGSCGGQSMTSGVPMLAQAPGGVRPPLGMGGSVPPPQGVSSGCLMGHQMLPPAQIVLPPPRPP